MFISKKQLSWPELSGKTAVEIFEVVKQYWDAGQALGEEAGTGAIPSSYPGDREIERACRFNRAFAISYQYLIWVGRNEFPLLMQKSTMWNYPTNDVI